MIRIRAAQTVDGFRVRLEFTDGTNKAVDLEPYLRGPIFDPIRADPKLFRGMRVDEMLGTIVWPNGADIDPDVLYGDLVPAWMEESAS